MTAIFHQVIGNDFADLKKLMDGAAEFLESEGVDAQVVFRINLTLEEIVSNIIKYGRKDGAYHPIDIKVLVKPEMVEAVIIDEGRAFNPVVHEKATPAEVLTERMVGGLGISLIKKMLDTMKYRRDGRRNIVEVGARRKTAGPTQ